MTSAATERTPLSSAERLAATWLGACVAVVVLDAALRAAILPAHAVFLSAAAVPVSLDRFWARRPRPRAVQLLESFAWVLGGAALWLTAGSDWSFLLWLGMPAAFAVLRGQGRWDVGEAAALGVAGALALWASAGLGAVRLGWSYGAMSFAAAFAGAAVLIAAAATVVGGRRAAAAEAARIARRFRVVMEASPDIFLLVDARGVVRAGYGGGEGKLVPEAGRLVGAEAASLFAASEEARLAEALDEARRLGEPLRLIAAGDGGLIELRLSSAGAGDVAMALRPASIEVEALPKAEQERDAADAAARARSRFFAGMSHELRTPLNAVLGFSDAMRHKMFGPLSAKYSEYAEDIHQSARHLLDLVGDILDLSRIEAGRYELERERFDAREAAEAASRMMRPAADAGEVALEIEVGSDPIEVEADLRALKQMLLNLTSNAVKFAGPKGVVRIGMAVEDGALVATVSDTGPGLSQDDIARLGRPFEQTREGRQHAGRSTGLGLSLVKSLSELHGGRLEIESALGRGATFRVRLPVIATPDAPPTSMDARGRLKRIRDAGYSDDATGEA